MGDLTTSGCDTVNSGLSTCPHVARTNQITSLSVLSMNPPVELPVILVLKFSDILPPLLRLLFAEMAGRLTRSINIIIFFLLLTISRNRNGAGCANNNSFDFVLNIFHFAVKKYND
jgi:hypothetical protein